MINLDAISAPLAGISKRNRRGPCACHCHHSSQSSLLSCWCWDFRAAVAINFNVRFLFLLGSTFSVSVLICTGFLSERIAYRKLWRQRLKFVAAFTMNTQEVEVLLVLQVCGESAGSLPLALSSSSTSRATVISTALTLLSDPRIKENPDIVIAVERFSPKFNRFVREPAEELCFNDGEEVHVLLCQGISFLVIFVSVLHVCSFGKLLKDCCPITEASEKFTWTKWRSTSKTDQSFTQKSLIFANFSAFLRSVSTFLNMLIMAWLVPRMVANFPLSNASTYFLYIRWDNSCEMAFRTIIQPLTFNK